MKGGEGITTIKGIIIPVDWDEKGKVVAAALSTHTEDEYLIDNDRKGKELLHCIQKEVEVSGVTKENRGKKAIKVTKYTLQRHGNERTF